MQASIAGCWVLMLAGKLAMSEFLIFDKDSLSTICMCPPAFLCQLQPTHRHHCCGQLSCRHGLTPTADAVSADCG